MHSSSSHFYLFNLKSHKIVFLEIIWNFYKLVWNYLVTYSGYYKLSDSTRMYNRTNITHIVEQTHYLLWSCLFVFVLCFAYLMLPVSLDCPLLVAPFVILLLFYLNQSKNREKNRMT